MAELMVDLIVLGDSTYIVRLQEDHVCGMCVCISAAAAKDARCCCSAAAVAAASLLLLLPLLLLDIRGPTRIIDGWLRLLLLLYVPASRNHGCCFI